MANKYIHPDNCCKAPVMNPNAAVRKKYEGKLDAHVQHEKKETMADEMKEYKGNVKVPK